MRVLFVTTSYPAHRSDPRGIHVHRLAKSLSAAGVDVRVVVPGSSQAASDEVDGIPVDRCTYWIPSRQHLTEGLGGIMPNIRSKPWLVLQIPSMIWAVYRGVRRHRHWAEIVHAHWLYPAGVIATYAAKDKPLVVTSHGGDLNRTGARGITYRVVKRVLARAQLLIGVSQSLTDRMIELGADSAKTVFRPLGVDVAGNEARAEWPRRRGALGVAFVGSLIPRKAPEILIEAAAQLGSRGSAVSIAFLGAGPLQQQAAKQADDAGVDVDFLGNVAPDDVGKWLNAADVLCLPSWSEGRPLAVMEAMAAAKPVVASNIDGVSELVTDETGALFAPGDAAGLADALDRLAGDESLRRGLGEAGRERLLSLGLDAGSVAKSHIGQYQKLLVSPQSS